MKATKHISLDPEVAKAVDIETQNGNFCCSKWANKALKERLKDILNGKS